MTLHACFASRRPFGAAFVAVLLLALLTAPALAKKAAPEEFNDERNQMIALMLSQQLPAQHFSHEQLDDKLSRKAFDLYLRQLDPRKRFLLQADVQQLNAFATHIDDELSRGKVILPDAGMALLNDRIHQVEQLIDPILDQGFDVDSRETLEIEPKKLDFAVVFMHIRKVSRGFYEGEFTLITETPRETAPYEITEKHVRELEKQISEQPWTWLWSHKRWKYRKDKVDQWQAANMKRVETSLPVPVL